MSLLTDASLLLTPNAYKASKLYSVIPSNGNGDFTATRATTATRINSSGLVEIVALNVPRVDYSLGGCPNILLEPQRTNLALQSSSFDNSSWAKTNVSVTANATVSPSGIIDADTISVGIDLVAGRHRVLQTFSVTSGVTYSASYFLKKAQHDWIQICAVTGFSTDVWANFNLATGVIGNTGGAGTTARIENIGSGWYRCTITGVANATGGATMEVIVINNTNGARYPSYQSLVAQDVCYAWGAQFEAGAYATSYIPTTTASVTRNADSITRNNIYTNGLITAAGGTWFVELRGNVARTRDAQSRIGLGDTSNLGANNLTLNSLTSGRITIQKFIAGVPTVLFTTTTDTCKLSIKWNGSTADIFQNGVKVVSATAFTITNMEFLNSTSIGVPFYFNEMALFPTPLTDAQCLALTA